MNTKLLKTAVGVILSGCLLALNCPVTGDVNVSDIDISEESITKTGISASEEEIELIALCCMGEAEGEPDVGKRLVIDTILNRVNSPYFPDTIAEVVWQDGQFTCMTNGRIDDCYISEDICELVREELAERLDYDVIFFRAGDYSDYGTPLYHYAGHYFSAYKEVEA